MATEHVRSQSSTAAFPWNLIGHALYRHPVWLQTASVWGVYGVGALVVARLALLARGHRARPRPAASSARGPARARRPESGAPSRLRGAVARRAGVARRAAPAQPHRGDALDAGGRRRDVPRGASRRRARPATAQPALIVIPESALPVYWDAQPDPAPGPRDDRAARGRRSCFNDVEEEPDGRYYNVGAAARRPAASRAPPYRKVHLVPFGEYVPLPRVFFFVRQISTEIGAFTRGRGADASSAAGPLAIGTAICYETIYPSLARQEAAGRREPARRRSPTTPGTAGAAPRSSTSPAPSCGRSRTTGTSLRAAITGISGIVDARGRDPRGNAGPNERTLAHRRRAARDADARPGRAGDSGSRGSPTCSPPPCYSSASSAGGASRRRRPATDGSQPTSPMTERDDLLCRPH